MRRFHPGAVLMLACLLSACKDDGSGDMAATPPRSGGKVEPGFPEKEPQPAAADAGCSWPFVSNPDLINVAFPDEAATYWVGGFPAIPGTRLRVEGGFPQARYFSFNVYDPQLRPVDAVTDYQLLTREGGHNPYRAADVRADASYVAYVVPEPKPEQPAPNTLYSGSIALPGGQSLPLNPMMLVIYRIYLPEGDGNGGVPLPKLTLETSDGTPVLGLSLCDPLPPDSLPGLVNAAIREASFPAAAPAQAVAPPGVNRFYNLPETGRVLLSSLLGVELPPNALTEGGGGGFLSNVDNAYVSALFRRDRGSLYVVRARAPRAAQHPSEAPGGTAQLRYWSLCTNEILSQRFVACLTDHEVPLDAQGYFTLVVSDPAERPANALPENGIAWLPWGGIYPDSLLIYRHMLPSAHFAEAIQNIPYGTPVEEVMGEYAPQPTYCDRATVEAAGNDARAAFERCKAAFAP